MTSIAVTFLAAFLSLTGAGAGPQVRDLPRSDPDRAALLDAARHGEDIKFVVRDFVKGGDYAFLCAFKKEPAGGIQATDESLDVHWYFFVREGARWVALPQEGGFADRVSDIPCEIHLPDDLPRGAGESHPVVLASEADLTRVIVMTVQSAIRYDLDRGSVEQETLERWQLLGRKKIAQDFSIEHEKPKTQPIPDQVKWQQRECKSPACKQAVKDAFPELIALRNSARVSSLVWGNCYQDADLPATRACVSEMSSRPYCRPSMRFLADRRDIDRCTAEIRARARR